MNRQRIARVVLAATMAVTFYSFRPLTCVNRTGPCTYRQGCVQTGRMVTNRIGTPVRAWACHTVGGGHA